ncbi:Oidioi.mRNA.OKI2018_I69.chr2.g8183.t1.cds [Oikopleura dioica]|uniref:Oidioi.mRNA.OKI2018_I69.chr2.g8183.t1.cds n=1 Tax=Oikopleura dioica TaxID=34765 RepID=A0ABN7T8G0_OIKDI|nr:Oidioi.mRNA.OKI2018_I69.chr2.g8183.t1.cds [Oikopleura dioica]
MAGKKGSQKFEFSCSTGVAASVTELSCYDDGNFYASKADKKKGRPFDTNTVIDCLDGNSGGGDSLEEACYVAFDEFFEKKGQSLKFS